MVQNPFAAAAGSLALVFAVMWLALIVAVLAGPFLMFSIAGNLRGIRRALDRAYPPPAAAVVDYTAPVPSKPVADAPRSMGHQLLR